MKTKTKNLIVVIAVVFVVVALLGAIGNIDFKLQIDEGGAGGDTKVCVHETHNKYGVCTNCNTMVQHTYEFVSAEKTSTVSMMHNNKYICTVCGSEFVSLANCTFVSGKCSACGGAEPVTGCLHSSTTGYCNKNGNGTHSVEVICDSCAITVSSYTENCSFDEVRCTSSENGEHATYYECNACEQGKTVISACVEGDDGLCEACGFDVSSFNECSHATHDEDGYCISCEACVGHDYWENPVSNGDGTHFIGYGCSQSCGYGGNGPDIDCTIVDGKCTICGYEP